MSRDRYRPLVSACRIPGRRHHANENRYGALVLVAEPHFLGELRTALDAPTAALVTATLDKDLGGIETRDLAQHLAGVLKL